MAIISKVTTNQTYTSTRLTDGQVQQQHATAMVCYTHKWMYCSNV